MNPFSFTTNLLTGFSKQDYHYQELSNKLETNLYELRQVRKLSLLITPIITSVVTTMCLVITMLVLK